MEHKEILNKIKSGIVDRDPKAEIYLYGSRAREDNRPDTDWDILVITSKE